MNITIDFGHIITLVIGLGGLYAALGKVLIAQVERRLEEKFNTVATQIDAADKSIKAQTSEWGRLERDIMTIRVDLAERYAKETDIEQIRQEIQTGFARLYDKIDGKVSHKECEQNRRGVCGVQQ